jgi:hypothetical protein
MSNITKASSVLASGKKSERKLSHRRTTLSAIA